MVSGRLFRYRVVLIQDVLIQAEVDSILILHILRRFHTTAIYIDTSSFATETLHVNIKLNKTLGLDTRQPRIVFKKLHTRQSEIIIEFAKR